MGLYIIRTVYFNSYDHCIAVTFNRHAGMIPFSRIRAVNINGTGKEVSGLPLNRVVTNRMRDINYLSENSDESTENRNWTCLSGRTSLFFHLWFCAESPARRVKRARRPFTPGLLARPSFLINSSCLAVQ